MSPFPASPLHGAPLPILVLSSGSPPVGLLLVTSAADLRDILCFLRLWGPAPQIFLGYSLFLLCLQHCQLLEPVVKSSAAGVEMSRLCWGLTEAGRCPPCMSVPTGCQHHRVGNRQAQNNLRKASPSMSRGQSHWWAGRGPLLRTAWPPSLLPWLTEERAGPGELPLFLCSHTVGRPSHRGRSCLCRLPSPAWSTAAEA